MICHWSTELRFIAYAVVTAKISIRRASVNHAKLSEKKAVSPAITPRRVRRSETKYNAMIDDIGSREEMIVTIMLRTKRSWLSE